MDVDRSQVYISSGILNVGTDVDYYIGYVLKGSTLKGNLNIRSNYFNLNDFITASADEASTSEAASTDSVATAKSNVMSFTFMSFRLGCFTASAI